MSEGRALDSDNTQAICLLLLSAVCSAQFPGTSPVGADEVGTQAMFELGARVFQNGPLALFGLRFKGRFKVTMFPQGSQKLFLVGDGMVSSGGDLEKGNEVMSRKPRSKDCLSSVGQCHPRELPQIQYCFNLWVTWVLQENPQ